MKINNSKILFEIHQDLCIKSKNTPPTNEATNDGKPKHIEQLQSIIETIPKHDTHLIMGDVNAKIGKDKTGHEDAMGIHGLGEMNNSSAHLINLCEINKLVVTGSLFPHKDQHNVTWISPGESEEPDRSCTGHQTT
jgi:hypothetical protein